MMRGQDPMAVSSEAVRLGYEPGRMRVGGFIIFLFCFAITMAALNVGIWFLMRFFTAANAQEDSPRSIAAPVDAVPPAPLQPSVGHDATPAQDLQTLRSEEDATFARLGWSVDPAAHKVTLPPDIVDLVIRQQAQRQNGAKIPPSATGRGANTIGAAR